MKHPGLPPPPMAADRSLTMYQRPREWHRELSVGQRPACVLANPADPDGLERVLADGARAGNPEFPVDDVQHVIGIGLTLPLHRKDENISAVPDVGAVLMTHLIELAAAGTPE